MKLPIWLTMGTIAALSGGMAISACSDDKKLTNTGGDSGVASGACVASAGQFPAPDCASDSIPPVCTNAGTCAIDEAKCGSKSTCMPLGDNSSRMKLDFRMRRLTVVAPAALASATIQNAVVDHGVSLNAKACGESGDGSFTWLLRIDKSNNTLTTGGAPPTPDPFATGYCFAKTKSAGSNIDIVPATAVGTLNGNKFSMNAPVDKLNVPIFANGDPNQLIILPISYAKVQDITISENGNCIGSFNYPALDNQCGDSRSDCSRWHTAGSLGGYITLEEADGVPIPQLGGRTLCVMLTQSTPGADGKSCQRDGNNKIKFQGDFCSTTKMPGGCADSYWMAATFAASAVKINDNATDPLCNGAAAGDAGADSGSNDAATTD